MLHGCFSQPLRVCAITLLLYLSGGCSNSDEPAQVTDELRSTLADPSVQLPSSSTLALPVALLDLQAGSALTNPLPDIKSSEVLAESGLQVSYTEVEQSAIIPALTVEANWLHMQSCLNQVGVAPLVLIRSSVVAPFTSSDDVLHTIDGIPIASASPGSIPVIQIGLSDFTVTGDANGFNLRSIMGRTLWSSAGLAARDYPFSCARQRVES